MSTSDNRFTTACRNDNMVSDDHSIRHVASMTTDVDRSRFIACKNVKRQSAKIYLSLIVYQSINQSMLIWCGVIKYCLASVADPEILKKGGGSEYNASAPS